MNERIITNIKTLANEMITNTKIENNIDDSTILYTLFAKHLNLSFNDKTWINRDRLITTNAPVLYATICMAGFMNVNSLKDYHKIGSKTPSYPYISVTSEGSIGYPGQGLATAVGMALGEQILYIKHKLDKTSLIDYKIYVHVNDDDVTEGAAYEASALAGSLKLNNLIVLYSHSKEVKEDVLKKYKALNWKVIKSTNNVKKINSALVRAKLSSSPTIIVINTKSSLKAKIDLEKYTKENNIPNDNFYIDSSLKEKFKEMITSHSSLKYTIWSKNYEKYITNSLGGDGSKLSYLFNKVDNYNILNSFSFEKDLKEPLVLTYQNMFVKLTKIVPNLIVSTSENLSLEEENMNDNIINLLNCESSMGYVLNGLSLSKFKVSGLCPLVLADKLKPAIRTSAILKLPIIYAFSNDSVRTTSRGTVFEPIEQLAMLRGIPNLNVFRPADANELLGCLNEIINYKSSTSALVLSSMELPNLLTSRADLVNRGAYLVFQMIDVFSAIIIATGSDVHTAYNIANNLWEERKINIRVVSMPCMEIYLNQPSIYQDRLIPPQIKTFVIESGSSFGWDRFVKDRKCLITIDKFGTDGSANDVLKYCNFDYESIKKQILDNL